MKPYTTKFSYGNAYTLALASKAVYECNADKCVDEDKVLEIMKGQDPDYISVKGFSKKSSQGAIIKHKDYIIIAFRGTDEFGDWLDNINVFPVERYFGKVHNGFYKALMDIWEGEDGMWEEIKNEPLPFWITGHSLGGAMATLAAADLIEKDQPFYGVYTYGQPRCGDRIFSRIFNMEAKERFFRFQNNNDIVTRAPSRLAGYSHVGKGYYISAHPEQKISDDVGIWYKFLDSVKGAINSIKEEGIDAVEDHNIGDYLNAIKKYAER
jgi:triacylglycerol lipase